MCTALLTAAGRTRSNIAYFASAINSNYLITMLT